MSYIYNASHIHFYLLSQAFARNFLLSMSFHLLIFMNVPSYFPHEIDMHKKKDSISNTPITLQTLFLAPIDGMKNERHKALLYFKIQLHTSNYRFTRVEN